MKVDVVNLKRHFGRTRAVDGISFSFETGHVFGFVGPNGSGKTTTMRILATLDEPTEGDILVDGASVTEDPEAVRCVVGFVPDALPAHPDITVHEYLDFFARAYGLRGASRRKAVAGVEEFTSLEGMCNRVLSALSKGMKQRVSVARALVHDPAVLVMDEPAAGLDPRARVELRELLALLGRRDKAILISSHILTELTEICNGAVIIEKGRILETGIIDEILSRSSLNCILRVRALVPPDELCRLLLQTAGVTEADVSGATVTATVDGGEDVAAELLKTLVEQGCPVVDFRVEKEDLEDIFLKVTNGEVQ